MVVQNGPNASSKDKAHKPFSTVRDIPGWKPSPDPSIDTVDPLGWKPIPKWKMKEKPSRPLRPSRYASQSPLVK